MKQFEIYSYQPSGWPEPHPCVIVSHPDRADRKNPVEVAMCSSKKTTRPAQAHEIILDEADGLDWPTLCKCDLIYAVPKDEMKIRRGEVSPTRRPLLVRKIIAAHGWGEILTG